MDAVRIRGLRDDLGEAACTGMTPRAGVTGAIWREYSGARQGSGIEAGDS